MNRIKAKTLSEAVYNWSIFRPVHQDEQDGRMNRMINAKYKKENPCP